MIRVTMQRMGYRAVAMIIWLTAAVAGASSLVTIQSASDQTNFIPQIIAAIALLFMGFERFAHRDIDSPPREEISTWLLLLLMVAIFLVIGLVYNKIGT
jgi:FtsH-binding integral membrane protein